MTDKQDLQALIIEYKTELELRLKQQYIEFCQEMRRDLEKKVDGTYFKEKIKRRAPNMDYQRLKDDHHALKVYCYHELHSMVETHYREMKHFLSKKIDADDFLN